MTAEVQICLKALGFFDGTVDGANTPSTQAALMHFAQRNGLIGQSVAQITSALRRDARRTWGFA